jgi:hypothetical protein
MVDGRRQLDRRLPRRVANTGAPSHSVEGLPALWRRNSISIQCERYRGKCPTRPQLGNDPVD